MPSPYVAALDAHLPKAERMAAWDWLKWAVSVLLLARLVTELDWRLMGRPAALRVCFLTDVEGNWSYFKQFVLRSKCLRFADTSGHDDAEPQLELQDDCMLVFGGDAGDKGDDTLRCYEQLVQLKQRYPTRVVLLVGNRDVNKMRFTSELADSEMDLATMAKEIYEGPQWVLPSRRMTLARFLVEEIKRMDKASVEALGDQSSHEILSSLPRDLVAAANTKVNRLKYMLEHTMGSQGDFDRRRRELARKRQEEPSAVDDQTVLQSYEESVQEGGVIREYLLHGSLAFTAHGSLFVHGGIINGRADASEASLGSVPGSDGRYKSVSEWIEKLNGWYQSEVRAWIDQPTWNSDHSSRGGNELLKYVLPDHPSSVVVGRHLKLSGMPTQLPGPLVPMLTENGIQRVIVGHTPHGNCPTVVKQTAGDGLFKDVIMCDTSYSDMSAEDNRGSAVSELILNPDGQVEIQGMLQDGHPIAYTADEDPWIGRLLTDGTLVKAKLADTEDEYLVVKVQFGYSYSYNYRHISDLEAIGLAKEDQSN